MCQRGVYPNHYMGNIYFKIKIGGHFEIQDGCHNAYDKKWNQLQFCSIGSKHAKKHWFQKCIQNLCNIT